MRRIARLGWNDLLLTMSDPPALVWLLVLPIAMTWLFSFSGGQQSPSPKIALDVVDLDGGWLGEALLVELERGEHGDDERVAVRRLEDGSADEPGPRKLVIPPGFTTGVLGGEVQTLKLEMRSGASETFSRAAQARLERAIARTQRKLALLEPGPASRERFDQLPRADPAVHLSVSVAGAGTPVPSGAAQSVPGMLTFLVLMMTVIYGAVFLTIEKRTGMLRRQATLPLGRMRILLGKLLGRLYIAGLQILILVFAGRYLFGISWGRSHAGLLSRREGDGPVDRVGRQASHRGKDRQGSVACTRYSRRSTNGATRSARCSRVNSRRARWPHWAWYSQRAC